jgi:hypothetical protein
MLRRRHDAVLFGNALLATNGRNFATPTVRNGKGIWQSRWGRWTRPRVESFTPTRDRRRFNSDPDLPLLEFTAAIGDKRDLFSVFRRFRGDPFGG